MLASAYEVSFDYGATRALSAISLTLKAGQGLAVLGANGAGKSTLLRLLAKQAEPSDGSLDFGLSRIAWVPQLVLFFPDLTVAENLKTFARIAGQPIDLDKEITRIALGHQAHQRASRLSGGQQRLLNLGLALVTRPDVLVLDEPTAGVDVETRAVIHRLLDHEKQGGLGLILTTHDMTEAQRLADHLIVLDQGRKVADRSLSALVETDLKDKVELAIKGQGSRLVSRDKAMRLIAQNTLPDFSLREPSIEAITAYLITQNQEAAS